MYTKNFLEFSASHRKAKIGTLNYKSILGDPFFLCKMKFNNKLKNNNENNNINLLLRHIKTTFWSTSKLAVNF